MKASINKLKVPSTSAFILLFSKSLYTTNSEIEYLSNIDFDDVKELVETVNKKYEHFERMCLYRKHYVRNAIGKLLAKKQFGQLVSLGAGLDPLTLFLAEKHPTAIKAFFEIDISFMAE